MLEVEPVVGVAIYGHRKWPKRQRSRHPSAASEAFARWLHDRYAAVELPLAGDIPFHCAIPWFVRQSSRCA